MPGHGVDIRCLVTRQTRMYPRRAPDGRRGKRSLPKQQVRGPGYRRRIESAAHVNDDRVLRAESPFDRPDEKPAKLRVRVFRRC